MSSAWLTGTIVTGLVRPLPAPSGMRVFCLVCRTFFAACADFTSTYWLVNYSPTNGLSADEVVPSFAVPQIEQNMDWMWVFRRQYVRWEELLDQGRRDVLLISLYVSGNSKDWSSP